MDIKIWPGQLSGKVQAPPSKSLAHRGLICASLAEGQSSIKGISRSKDMEATIGAMRSLGAFIELQGDSANIVGIGSHRVSGVGNQQLRRFVDCQESGSTLRFVVPIAGALGMKAEFQGKGKLPQRPMDPLIQAMEQKGINIALASEAERANGSVLMIEGKLQPGQFQIPGNISSQYISGLLFALPLLDGDSTILVEGPLESKAYINLTLQVLHRFGIIITDAVERQNPTSTQPQSHDNLQTQSQDQQYRYHIKGQQHYLPGEYTVEGDYSNGAFWLTAKAILQHKNRANASIHVSGLNPDSLQGDKDILQLLETMFSSIQRSEQETLEIDGREIPDLIPILSVAASLRPGKTAFRNLKRLRIKESDRLSAIADCLQRLGADIQIIGDDLFIVGKDALQGGTVSGYNDHRMVMSMAIAALFCKEPVIIEGMEAVEKSYPDFFVEYGQLGGIFEYRLE